MRAIILAAGMGTRLRPLTENTPKGLVKINEIPMVEKEIIYLQEIGIEEIIIVTGYLNEQFNYLKKKYNVKLIHNDKYDIYNNLYTMYLVREYLSDAYVLESDIYMNNNVLNKEIKRTSYFGVKEKNFKNEWILNANEDKRIYEIKVESSEEDVILRGISYWNKKDGEFIANKLEEAVQNRDFTDLYWDDIVKENLAQIEVYLNELNYNDAFEIDNIEDYKKVEAIVRGSSNAENN